MTKNILLKLNDEDFYKLYAVKTKLATLEKQAVSWERFIVSMLNFKQSIERGNKKK